MSDYTQMLLQITGIVTLLVTIIVSPFIAYLIANNKANHVAASRRIEVIEDELKISNKKLDKAHHRNFRVRILMNRLIGFIKSFRVAVFEVVEESYTTKTPVTEQQIQRLKNASDVDSTLDEYHRFEHEEDGE